MRVIGEGTECGLCLRIRQGGQRQISHIVAAGLFPLLQVFICQIHQLNVDMTLEVVAEMVRHAQG